MNLSTPIDNQLINIIIQHEGSIPYAYTDSKGYLTIGVGRLIDKRLLGKLSQDEIAYLLNNDLISTQTSLTNLSWYSMQDDIRKGAIIELCFNMGLPRLLGFAKMIAALKISNYENAANELIASDWANDVGNERSSNLYHRILYGAYP